MDTTSSSSFDLDTTKSESETPLQQEDYQSDNETLKDEELTTKNDLTSNLLQLTIHGLNPENDLNNINVNEPNNTDENYISDDDVKTDDLVLLEPKLREAWITMRKLDKKLSWLSKKEKKAKLETIALMERNKNELEKLRLTSNHIESKLEAQNTEKFLALTYLDLDQEENPNCTNRSIDSDLHTPLFKTQVPFSDELDETNMATKEPNIMNTEKKDNKRSDSYSTTKTGFKPQSNDSVGSKSAKKSSKNEESEKNFIKRNIQLVQDNAGILAMTPEEKNRLKELMSDVDDSNTTNQNQILNSFISEENLTYLVNYNPNQVIVEQGDGFTPNREEKEKLKQIDAILENRILSRLNSNSVSHYNPSEFGGNQMSEKKNSIADSNSNTAPSLQDDINKQIKLNDEFDENEFGDKFIRDARISREQEIRLKYIDLHLEKVKQMKSVQKMSESSSGLDQDEECRDSFNGESTVNEGQIKQLIEDFYSEVEFNQKISTNNDQTESGSDSYEINKMNNKIQLLSEIQIKALLNDVGYKDNGDALRDESDLTQYSYYDEALKIIADKENLQYNEILNEDQTVPPKDDKELFSSKQDLNENLNNIDQSKNFEITRNQYYNNDIIQNDDNDCIENNDLTLYDELDERDLITPRDDSNQTPKLPMILQENKNSKQNSFLSNISLSRNSGLNSSSGSIVLPKIDDRYLPK